MTSQSRDLSHSLCVIEAMQAQSIDHVDTEYSADCIEWCPFEGYQDLFICGTYQVLDPAKSSSVSVTDGPPEQDGKEDSDDEVEGAPAPSTGTQRTGRLLLFQVQEDSGGADGSEEGSFTKLREIQRIDTNAILDAKWHPHHSSPPLLAVADAKGQIVFYSLVDGSSSDTRTESKLEHVQTLRVADPTVLCLSLDWSHRSDPTATPSLAVSLSNGSLAVISSSVAEQGDPDKGVWEVEREWHAHDYEPWCVAWDNWEPNTLWSGGDDLKLKRWNTEDPSFPTLTNKRFEAGVTTITSSPHTPHLLAVGSYDSILRLYDTRKSQRPLTEINVGGGIWRTRFHPFPERRSDILVAAMHDGFKVVRLDVTSATDVQNAADDDAAGSDLSVKSAEIIQTFEEHKSLAYGADWSRLSSAGELGSGEGLIATCSFYDHWLHLWRG